MSRSAFLAALMVAVLVLPSAQARADGSKKKSAKPAAAAAPTASTPAAGGPGTGNVDPAPGTCEYALPTMKVCVVANGVGVFDVYSAAPATVTIHLQEWPRLVIEPDTEAFQTKKDAKTLTITLNPLLDPLPDKTNMVITTSTANITLIFHPGSKTRLDTQLEIRDPKLDVSKAEIERQVAERTKVIEEEHAKRLQDLNVQAEHRAEELLLDDLAAGRVETRGVGGDERSSNAALIIIHGERIVRFGDRRYLLLTIDNQSASDIEITGVKVTKVEGSVKTPVPVTWRFTNTKVAARYKASGAVLLPRETPSSKASFTVRVEEADPSRSVELSGIRVP